MAYKINPFLKLINMATVGEAVEKSYEGEPSWVGLTTDQYAQKVTLADFLTDAGIRIRERLDDPDFMSLCQDVNSLGVNIICDEAHLAYAYMRNPEIKRAVDDQGPDNEFWNLCRFFWKWWEDRKRANGF
jgi:hypothetical protein